MLASQLSGEQIIHKYLRYQRKSRGSAKARDHDCPVSITCEGDELAKRYLLSPTSAPKAPISSNLPQGMSSPSDVQQRLLSYCRAVLGSVLLSSGVP